MAASFRDCGRLQSQEETNAKTLSIQFFSATHEVANNRLFVLLVNENILEIVVN